MAFHERIRQGIDRVFHKFLSRIGVSKRNINTYRDNALAIPAVIAVILSLKPVFYLADGMKVTGTDIKKALLWSLVSIGVSALSPNWNQILGVAWCFMGIRGIVGLAKSSGDPRVLLITIVFFLVSIALTYLKVILSYFKRSISKC